MSDFAVKANIYNILNDNPTASDCFLVDTNVWLFSFFPKLGMEMAERDNAQKYENYTLKKVRNAGGTLFHCRPQLLEIAHVIEETLFGIYKESLSQGKLLKLKDYRKNDKERTQVIHEIKDCWSQINAVSTPVDVEFNSDFESAVLTHITNYRLDQFDGILLECSNKAKMIGIITDDSDLAQVDGIKIFTYNQRVIREATTSKKLLARKKSV